MARPIKFELKIEYLWGLVALVGIFVFINTHPIRPQDFWWHITIGREILSTGKIPTIDIYSYTAAGQPYPSYQMFWLMEITLYEIYKLGGPSLVIFLYSVMITAAYGIIFWICQSTSKSFRIAAFGLLLAAALGLNDWNVRPQGITFLLASLFLLAILQIRRTRRWIWLLIFPLAMLVWVNSHGTFLIGLVILAIWFGQEIWEAVVIRLTRKQTVILKSLLLPGVSLLVTLLICFVNPRGFGILNYIKTLAGSTVVQNLVTEWAPPTFNTLMGAIFFVGLMLSALIFALSPVRPGFSQLLTFLVFGFLSLKTSRGSVWFGLVMAPELSLHLSYIIKSISRAGRPSSRNEGSRYLNIIFALVVIILGLVSLPWFKSALPLPQAKAGLVSAETPVKATQVLLDAHPLGEVFNAASFGSYLIWAAYPQYQVFVDPRIELFPEKVWLDYLDISNANGDWETLLKEYGVNTLMLSPIEQPGLIAAVQQSSGWTLLFQDQAALIFVRK